MPKLIPANINNPKIFFGQLYRMGTAIPFGHTSEPGICLGLVLSWIRNIHVGKPLSYIPNELEGAIGQFICEYKFGVPRMTIVPTPVPAGPVASDTFPPR